MTPPDPELSDPEPPGLDPAALANYLEAARPGLISAPLTAALINGGHSNLTYSVRDADGRELIVRRPPLGHVLATAHDMAREYRVIAALAGTAIPVPLVHLLCTDPAVIGAPFFVMDKVTGVALRHRAELERLGPRRVRRMTRDMIATLAGLHAVDPTAIGLADFGRPAGYLGRQVTRWRRQLEQSHTRDLPGLDELYRRLAESVPGESVPGEPRTALVHGDYRLDNLLVDVDADDRITAVLDWEMSTLGDPFVDVAVLAAYTQEATESPHVSKDNAANAAGFPSPAELIEEYAGQAGGLPDDVGFYLGLAFFKIAGILEGIHFRYLAGQTVGDGYAGVGARVPWLIEAGLAALTPAPPPQLGEPWTRQPRQPRRPSRPRRHANVSAPPPSARSQPRASTGPPPVTSPPPPA